MSNKKNNINSNVDVSSTLITKDKYVNKKTLINFCGFNVNYKIATTLQGSVYSVVDNNGNEGILKRAAISLHELGIGVVNGKTYRVKENIINEASILKYLNNISKKYKINGLISLFNFFCDNKNYFLLMSNAGNSLFDHIYKMHQLIKLNRLKIKEWKKHVKILFKQICQYVNWMHNKAKVVHMDISLENICIKGCLFKDGKFIKHGQIYFIDYGLSEIFMNKNENKIINCKKFVGKTNYQSPELYAKKEFNALKNDVWSLGVIYFIMRTGILPFSRAVLTDFQFRQIFLGYSENHYQNLGLDYYIDNKFMKITDKIFRPENKRCSIQQLLKYV